MLSESAKTELKTSELPEKLQRLAQRLNGCVGMQEDDFKFEAETVIQEAFLARCQHANKEGGE